MFTRIVFVFACGFLLVESKALKKRQQDGCERLVQCSAALLSSFEEEEGLPTYVSASDEETLNNICERKESQEQCIEDARGDCESEEVVADVDTSSAAADYICSDKGRRATLALANSQCATDENRQERLTAGIQNCLDKFEFEVVMLTTAAISEHRDLDPSDLCSFAEAWTECTVAAAESSCGNEYADFLSDVLEVTVEPRFEQFGCQDVVNNKRQILRRALDLMDSVHLRKKAAGSFPVPYNI